MAQEVKPEKPTNPYYASLETLLWLLFELMYLAKNYPDELKAFRDMLREQREK